MVGRLIDLLYFCIYNLDVLLLPPVLGVDIMRVVGEPVVLALARVLCAKPRDKFGQIIESLTGLNDENAP